MNRLILPTLALFLAAAPPSHAGVADPAALVAAKRSLQEAVNRGQAADVLAVRARLQMMSAAEPASALLHYWVALADWRATPLMLQTSKEEAKQIARDGLDHCERALALDAGFAEAHALQGGLLGMSISFSPASTMTLGPQSDAALKRALELAPDNPRVWLLDGIGTLHKPTFFGGGTRKARAKLDKAQGLFAAQSVSDSTAPDWGHDDAFVWAGRCAVEDKDYEAAAAYYERALSANPSNGWVRFVLLPELEKARGTKPKS